MKKKILFSIITLFVVSLFTVVVNAELSRLVVGSDTKAKAPATVPAANTELSATVTENFDFSKVKFAPASGSEEIAGKEDLKKIILGNLKNVTSSTTISLDNVLDDWFTAYCLDNSKKYPLYGLLTSEYYYSATTNQLKLDEVVVAAVINDDRIQAKVNANSQLNHGGVTAIQVVKYGAGNTITGRHYELNDTDTVDDVLSKVQGLTDSVTVKLSQVDFFLGTTKVTMTAADITGNASDTTYDLTFKGKDLLLDKYTATASSSVTGYDHALWIIEHSYPTLALKTSVEASGADYDTLRKQVCELEGKTFNEETSVCTGLSNLDDYVENYVYGTVQYAIWKSTDHTVGGKELGNSITNSTELNKLYSYLIKNRSEYSGYSTKTFANKIKVNAPKEGDELYKETSNTYLYGPYKATYDALAGGDMTISVTNADKTGIKVVNASGTEITTLSNGGEFYIECTKSAKISSVTIDIKLEDASVFDPTTDRGRIYFPQMTVEQNVMSGGKIVNKNLKTTIELVANPKTGVENVALILMVTLVAFSLAYLLLSYKQKPVQLN